MRSNASGNRAASELCLDLKMAAFPAISLYFYSRQPAQPLVCLPAYWLLYSCTKLELSQLSKLVTLNRDPPSRLHNFLIFIGQKLAVLICVQQTDMSDLTYLFLS